jgi:hypothetical protein
VAAAALAAAAVYLLLPIPVVQVTSADPVRTLWRVPARPGAVVDLDYTNSIYNAATTERFVITGGLLRLIEVSSASEAVLQYLALEPPYERRDGRLVSRRPGPMFAELTIRIGRIGRQRLTVDGRPIPLYEVGVGEAVRVTIARVPRLRVLARPPRIP